MVPDEFGKPKFSARDLAALYTTMGTRIFEPWDTTTAIAEAERSIAPEIAGLGLFNRSAELAPPLGDGAPVPPRRALLHPKYTASGLKCL